MYAKKFPFDPKSGVETPSESDKTITRKKERAREKTLTTVFKYNTVTFIYLFIYFLLDFVSVFNSFYFVLLVWSELILINRFPFAWYCIVLVCCCCCWYMWLFLFKLFVKLLWLLFFRRQRNMKSTQVHAHAYSSIHFMPFLICRQFRNLSHQCRTRRRRMISVTDNSLYSLALSRNQHRF